MLFNQKLFFTGLILMLVFSSFLPIINLKNQAEAAYSFTENFTTTTYRDAGATTADWDTVGEQANMVPDRETQVTTDTNSQTLPVIYGDYIVWTDLRSGGDQIYMYQISTNIETQVTTDDGPAHIASDIYNNYIVWQDDDGGLESNIYMCDLNLNGGAGGCLSGDTKTQITADLSIQRGPSIYGDYIVWEDARGGNWDIYMYQISTSTETPVAIGLNNQEHPAIYGNYITWVDDSAGNDDIYMCDLSLNGSTGGCIFDDTKTQITTDSDNQNSPDIFENYITWQDNRFGIGIYMYDLTTSTESRIFGVSGLSVYAYFPSIYDDYISFYVSSFVTSKYYVYAYKISTDTLFSVYETPRPGVSFSATNIYDGNIVWSDNSDGDQDVSLYNLNESSLAQSTTVDTTSNQIISATLTPIATTPTGTNIDYYLSNDGGSTWEATTSGIEHIFTSTGSDLRWRAIMTHSGDIGAIPFISQIDISYTADSSRRRVAVDPTDIIAPAPPSKVSATKFAYSAGQDLVISWQNPIDTDLAGTNIYRFQTKCPTNLSSLTLDTNSLLTQTSSATQAILDSSLDNINQAYCYIFQTEDINLNKSTLVSYEVIPAFAKSIFSNMTSLLNSSLSDQTDSASQTSLTNETPTETAITPIISDLIETQKAYDSKTNSLGLMNYLRGRFILLVESGYPANLYYVNPTETYPHRYVLNWKTMITSFGKLSLGITHNNLIKIPTCDSTERSNPLNFKTPTLLLDVNQNGEIWYYNQNCRQSITWKNMWEILPKQALGINLENLMKIPLGEVSLIK